MNERTFDENDENFVHHVHDDIRHHFVQLSLIDFVVHTISFRFEIRINMKNLSFKYFFFRTILQIY